MPTALYQYKAYGLSIDSDIQLPELLPLEPQGNRDLPPGGESERRHVSIRLGPVDRSSAPPPLGATVHWARPGDVCLVYPDVGVYHVVGGNRITVHLNPDANERALRLYLLGPVLGILLHQRNLLVIHASAVSVDGHVAVFAADKGEGKSTLAAVMHARGHQLVTDDLLPVDLTDPRKLLVEPGFPQLKLMPEAAAQLTSDVDSLPRLHPDFDKRATPIRELARQRLPLSRIFILQTADEDAIEPIAPQQRFIELVRHSYLAILLGATGEGAHHFRQVVALAQNVPVLKLKRRRSLDALATHAKLVEDEVRRSER
jgi:hypothetical protein